MSQSDTILEQLDAEAADGGENVFLTRAQARAIYSLALRGAQAPQSVMQVRCAAIVAKVASIGWPAA